MHSFLFPEDITSPSTRPKLQQSTANTRKTTQEDSRAKLPRMPTRAPPTIPQQNVSALTPPPTYAPPPIPMLKAKEPATAISVTELSLSIPDQQQELKPGLQRSKSKWSRREIFGRESFREKREKKVRAIAEVVSGFGSGLPELSPVVDGEFWRTGRYPASPSVGIEMVHVAF